MLKKTTQIVRANPITTVLIGAILVATPFLLVWAGTIAERRAYEEIARSSRHTLELSVTTLRSELRRYEVLPQILTEVSAYGEALRRHSDAGVLSIANGLLEEMAEETSAADIYLMLPSGKTIAASNWKSERTFIGKNFNYRPYFQQAMQGQLGRYFALGTTSNKRGYYFAYPKTDGGRIAGAIVVKVDIGRIEAALSNGPETILVTDRRGIVFMSTRPGWVFGALKPLGEAERRSIRESRQYADARITPLRIQAGEGRHGFDIVEVAEAEDGPAASIKQSLAMPETGWTVHILAGTHAVGARVRDVTLLTAAVLVLLVSTVVFIAHRRAAMRHRLALEAESKVLLERRVDERTRALSDANVQLEREVIERKTAEQKLRRTQDELVQASKMSALGQMSASISHELNQPLAAIRSFADNAVVMFERGDGEGSRGNLTRISELTARMARIIRHLRTFARNEVEPPVSVDLASAVRDALALIERRIAQEGAEVEWHDPAPVWVMGGTVRLQQVLVNLLTNALDAMRDQDHKRIEIAVETTGDAATLSISDSGHGIAPDIMKDIFDPFVTTKSMDEGPGLGLGLSISYGIIKGFGGTIGAENTENGGARFTVVLKRASAPAAAAE